MIRKFNYTGRKKIKRSAVRVDVLRDAEGHRFFNISLTFGDLNLPAAACIYVEAYHRTAYQRFPFGTVGNKVIPEDRYLTRFAKTATPLFRVKVVDRSKAHGRILAVIDKVRPENVDDQPSGSQSLLYVEYGDLGHRIWELDLDGDWPVLRLNQQAREIGLIASSDDRFLSLVYPEILRQILTRIVITDGHTDPDCDDDWLSLWLKLACHLSGRPVPAMGARDDQQRWIEAAIDAFGMNHRILERFERVFQEGR